MLQFDENVVDVLTMAFESGMNVPNILFKRQYDEQKNLLVGQEIVYNDPVWIIKPQGIEFTYITFWTGKKFRGGYVSLNNNYSGVQRGRFERNGETLFVGGIPELKKCYKKILPKGSGWLAYSFVMDEEGKVYFWGKDNIEHYQFSIGVLTGVRFDELERIFMEDEKLSRPEGFVSSAIIYDGDYKARYIHTAKKCQTLSKAWKNLYEEVDLLEKNLTYIQGIDSYMRKAYACLQKHNKLT